MLNKREVVEELVDVIDAIALQRVAIYAADELLRAGGSATTFHLLHRKREQELASLKAFRARAAVLLGMLVGETS